MQVVKHVFEYSSRSELPLRLVPVGDIHLGHRNVDFDILEKVLKYIAKTENCFFLGMGDYADSITTKDRRFDFQSLDLNYPTPDKQYRKIRELFEPIKDKCLGLLHGNHDYIHWKEHNHNYVDDLAYDLGVPYLTVDAYIRIVFKRKSGGHAKQRAFDLYAHHGWTGARTIGGRINRITDLANIFPGLPLYLMGHCHLLGPIPPRIQLKVNQGLQVVEMKQNFVFTGSFLRGYVPKAMSYVESKTYVPTALGSPVISIRPLEGKYPFEVKVSLITSET